MKRRRTIHSMVDGEYSLKEVLKFVLVIIGVIAVSFVVTISFGALTLSNFSRFFMGVFFIVFAGFKLAGYSMFVDMFASYDVIAQRFKLYSYLYPFIELTFGVFYLFDSIPFVRDIVTFIVMAISSIGVARELKKRSGIHCACLGNIIKLPLSTVSLVENVSMGLMALVMLILTAS